MASLSWGMHRSKETDTVFPAKQNNFFPPFYSKSLEIKDESQDKKKVKKKKTNIYFVSLLCQVRAAHLHLPQLLAPRPPLGLRFPDALVYCQLLGCAVLRCPLPGKHLPLSSPNSSSSSSDLCSLTAFSRKAPLTSLIRSVPVSQTLLAPCGSVLKHWSQL